MGVGHEVPLTPLMLAVVEAQPRTTSPLVFPPARHTDNGQITGWAYLVDRAVKASNVSFKLHDLRRSCRSLMSRLNVSPGAERCRSDKPPTFSASPGSRSKAWSRDANFATKRCCCAP